MICLLAGLLFAAMYFICRVVISNYFGWVMLRAVLAESTPSVGQAHLAPAPSAACFLCSMGTGLQEGLQFLACYTSHCAHAA